VKHPLSTRRRWFSIERAGPGGGWRGITRRADSLGPVLAMAGRRVAPVARSRPFRRPARGPQLPQSLGGLLWFAAH
jgi:hypothetical protein